MPLQPVTVSARHPLQGPQTEVPLEEEEVPPHLLGVVTGVPQIAGVLMLGWYQLLWHPLSQALVHPLLQQGLFCARANALLSSAAN